MYSRRGGSWKRIIAVLSLNSRGPTLPIFIAENIGYYGSLGIALQFYKIVKLLSGTVNLMDDESVCKYQSLGTGYTLMSF